MTRTNSPLISFNRGRISKLGLARTDLDRTKLSAEMQSNWMPRTLGSMMLRPGLKHIGTMFNSSTAILIPFVFSATDTYVLEFTSTRMRVRELIASTGNQDALVLRVASTAVITNGDFSSSGLTGWTDADQTGSTSYWKLTGTNFDGPGSLIAFEGTRYARAIRRQTVTAAAGTHGLAIEIVRGRVNFRAGSSSGGEDYFNEVSLRPGDYSFGITSTGTFFIEFSANTEYPSFLRKVAIESSGSMDIPTPWGGSILSQLRWAQSADVIFVTQSTIPTRRIERYAANSWGVARYDPLDGPFLAPNTKNIQFTPTALTGAIRVITGQAFFSPEHARLGTLFRITSIGQGSSVTPSGTDQWSNPISVSGVGETRNFSVNIISATGYVATVRAQRSIGTTDSFTNVQGLAWTSSFVSTDHNDLLDNQIIFYRIGGGSTYTSGSPECTLRYSASGKTGIIQVLDLTNDSSAYAHVLEPLGSTLPTELWEEGAWSSLRGFPSAVTFHEGRLWLAGKSKIWGSVADAYESFDEEEIGDSGPINRTIASGGVDKIQWMASLGRLIIGTESAELQVKTNTLEDPITPTNFNLREISNYGSAPVQAVKIDKRLLFVHRSSQRVMEISYSGETLDYETADRSIIVPEIGEPSITRMAVQRQPDTRLHCVRGTTDGTVGVLVSEPAENVAAWIDVRSTAQNGFIADVCVIPGSDNEVGEDSIYYIVRREINGSTVRYVEKWAAESNARGTTSNYMADSWEKFESTATTIVTGLSHLFNSSVIVWGATADLGSYTVSSCSSGLITLTQAATLAIVGLPYEGWYKSAKLAYAAEAGTALTQRKRVSHIGLVMADVHAQGLQFGPSTNSSDLDQLPLIETGTSISTDVGNTYYFRDP